MSNFWSVVTPEAVVGAIVAGLVFGCALPSLFSQVATPLIAEEQVDILNAAAGRIVPLLALPLGAVFFGSQALVELAAGGGSWPRALGRLLVFAIYTVGVTVGDVAWQRWRNPRPRVMARLDELEDQIHASEVRRELLRAAIEVDGVRGRPAKAGKP